jgi:ornithine cyclodeaminase
VTPRFPDEQLAHGVDLRRALGRGAAVEDGPPVGNGGTVGDDAERFTGGVVVDRPDRPHRPRHAASSHAVCDSTGVRVPVLDATSPSELLGWSEAVDALETALRSGLDPSETVPRTITPVAAGQLLTMPAAAGRAIGVKVITVAAQSLPRVKGLYVLFDANTLAPVLLLDGAALTLLRTAAHSALAVRHLATEKASHLVVFGSGPQAAAHIDAVRAVRPIERVTVVARNTDTGEALVTRTTNVTIALGSADAVEDADIVVCATTARAPLFAGDSLAPNACVVAVGAHEPDASELDDTVFGRARRVVVEDRATAMREHGGVMHAVAAGAIRDDQLLTVKDAIDLRPGGGIAVFAGVGMGWQDAVIADAVRTRHLPGSAS